jgi:hypothetical protein
MGNLSHRLRLGIHKKDRRMGFKKTLFLLRVTNVLIYHFEEIICEKKWVRRGFTIRGK